MATYPWSTYLKRILLILQKDSVLGADVKEFRYGDLGTGPERQIQIRESPCIYVTTPARTEVSIKAIAPAHDVDSTPGEEHIYEFFAILVVREGTPEKAQDELYRISARMKHVLRRNKRLKHPVDDDDPLCATLTVTEQGRFPPGMGSFTESATVRVRTVNWVETS